MGITMGAPKRRCPWLNISYGVYAAVVEAYREDYKLLGFAEQPVRHGDLVELSHSLACPKRRGSALPPCLADKYTPEALIADGCGEGSVRVETASLAMADTCIRRQYMCACKQGMLCKGPSCINTGWFRKDKFGSMTYEKRSAYPSRCGQSRTTASSSCAALHSLCAPADT